ncbi:Hsp20/alpha crystallin family protein [Plasticicumulans acidivorans]|uniref:Heat shock protein Hsp20 n=1 Tax=Plasticicumulans acidivorans TaxID=886464 RepID=A0A317MVR0_9GAMM|nr:Hsp20/alpha crystallin family protein [Plasticicumulans acidivorans]PWV62296.1 heat shock protein Hsp20 [Plasticicumulans acidivorans]
MSITRYDPWNRFNQMQKELERLLDPRLGGASDDSSSVATCDWVPAVDIKEEADRFVIHADIPGVDPQNIDITMENGVLTLKGQRMSEQKEAGEGYKRVERARGTFYRRFGLPDTADASRISAHGQHGVLEIVIPKQERAAPRKITVETR